MNTTMHRYLPWVLFILLQLFCLYMITHHAMWRDELQTWSMARESSNFSELFFNMRFDGTPPLWYVCLWFLSRFTSDPAAMQLFHFTCASSAALILMTKAPFPPAIRLLIVSGYYFSFEYMVISRGYVLGVLIACMYASLRPRNFNRPVLSAFILGLMANSTAYGCILSISLFCSHVYDYFASRIRQESNRQTTKLVTMLSIYGLLLAIAIYFMVPAPGGNFVESWNFTPSTTQVLTIYQKIALCLLPLPEHGIHYWNSLYLGRFGEPLTTLVATTLLAMTAVILSGNRRELCSWLLCFAGMLVFGLVVYLGFNRHGGTLYISFIVCLWLAASVADQQGGSPLPAGARFRSRLLVVLLMGNTASFAVASYNHSLHPFSGSGEMAGYLVDQHIDDRPIIGDIDFEVSPVAGYLNKPLYYLTNRKKETFIRWSTDRTRTQQQPVQEFIEQIATETRHMPLVLLSYPMELKGYRLLKATKPSTVQFERYYLYEPVVP